MKKMKRYNGEEGSDVKIDPLEAANASETSQDIAIKDRGESILKGMRDEVPKPRPRLKPITRVAPKAELKAVSEAASKPAPTDETKLSVSDRFKLSRDRARSGSGATDNRSVNQRLRSAFGMKKGGETKKMASGGMATSKRADGIATRGKTNCKMY